MMVTSTKQELSGTALALRLAFILILIFLLLWMVLRSEPPREEELVRNVELMRSQLVSQSHQLTAADGLVSVDGKVVLRAQLPVIGDGFATAAIIANLNSQQKVRVFGMPSFWQELHGVPLVWQSKGALKSYFENARLEAPEELDRSATEKKRLLWYALEKVRLSELMRDNVEYVLCAQGFEIEPVQGTRMWSVKDRCSMLVYDFDSAIVIATGVNEQIKISSARTSSAVLAQLIIHQKLVYADEYLSDPLERVDKHGKPLEPIDKDKTIAVVGPGGAGLDVAYHALAHGLAKQVVIWGDINNGLAQQLLDSNAYRQLKSKFGGNICRVYAQFSIDAVVNNGKLYPPNDDCCSIEQETLKSAGSHPAYQKSNNCVKHPNINKIVVAIGRDRSKPPSPLRSSSLAAPSPSADLVLDTNSALVATKLSYQFSDVTPVPDNKKHPVYLVGAAATWLHAGVQNKSSKDPALPQALDALVKIVNTRPGESNPPVGFAASVTMGATFARMCLKAQPFADC
jgi:hypothetical protein